MADLDYLYITGRLVQGDAFSPQTKNMKGGALTDKQGNPKVQYFMGVAVDKANAEMQEAWGKIQQAAQAGFPGGEWQQPHFAWKVIDGDQPANSGKTGFPGNYVFRLTSGFSYPVYNRGASAQIVDNTQLKRGDYIRVVFTVRPNGDTQKPGVYLNIVMVEFVGYGDQIVSGPDVAALLGGRPAAVLPPGASETPVAGPAVAVPGAPGAPAPGGMPTPGAPAPGGTPTPGAPAPGGMPTPGAPAPMAPAANNFLTPGAPAPVGPTMTAKAGGTTLGQFQAQGWTVQQLIEQGYMA